MQKCRYAKNILLFNFWQTRQTGSTPAFSTLLNSQANRWSGKVTSSPRVYPKKWHRQLWGTGARAPSTSNNFIFSSLWSNLAANYPIYCAVCEISWCRCQQFIALSISTALVTTLKLVIEQLLHPALKSTVSAPWSNFQLCPSSQQILATPLPKTLNSNLIYVVIAIFRYQYQVMLHKTILWQFFVLTWVNP